MKALGWLLGCGAVSVLGVCLIGIVAIAGGTPFNPGPLSAEHRQDQAVAEFATHADFESRCELCHTPFRGPDAMRCNECHKNVGDQIASAQGLHGKLRNAQDCIACHTDHKGRAATMTRITLASFSHNQFGYVLTRHQSDFSGVPMTCRSCHDFGAKDKSIQVAMMLTACVDCHRQADAQFVAKHRREMGDACLACHDGTDRLKGFKHAAVFALDGKHTQVICVKCHVDNRFRNTPRDCVGCHADPQVHRGQFGADCAACHTVSGWRPARLVKHTFPLNHGNKGKDSDCKICHPTNYATNTCYGCHEHTPDKMAQVHLKENIRDYQNCTKCHATGKK